MHAQRNNTETITPYNSAEYYSSYFDSEAWPKIQKAESRAVQDANDHLTALQSKSFSMGSESDRIANIFSGAQRINFSDFDGTRSRLEDLGEQRNQEVDSHNQLLEGIERDLGIVTIKVSGRPLVWPGIGLLKDLSDLPALAIGEAGAVMAIDGMPSASYQEFIVQRTGYIRDELKSEIEDYLRKTKAVKFNQITTFRPQVQNALTHKLSYDVLFSPGADGDVAAKSLQATLQKIAGTRAKIVQSHFIEARDQGVENSYRIDIVPGDKADATDYIADKLYEAQHYKPFITAGDSGNDIALVRAALNKDRVRPYELALELINGKAVTSNTFISVANSHPDLCAEVKREAVPASQFVPDSHLNGVYFLLSDEGFVAKLLLDDSEMPLHHQQMPAQDRHGPESILNAYAFLSLSSTAA